MASLQKTIQLAASQAKDKGQAAESLTIASRRVIDKKNRVSFDPDNNFIILRDQETLKRQKITLFGGELRFEELAFTRLGLLFAIAAMCIISLIIPVIRVSAATGDVIGSEVIFNSGSNVVLLSGSTQASGTLTLGLNPDAGDVITVGTQSYIYSTTNSGTASTTNLIVIGTSAAVTGTNTAAASPIMSST